MASAVAGRGITRTYNPIMGLRALQNTGVLPTLEQNKPGYDISYLVPQGFTASSPTEAARGLAQIASTKGLEIVQTLKPQDVPWWQQLAIIAGGLIGIPLSSGVSLAGTTLAGIAPDETKVPTLGTQFIQPSQAGGSNMAFQDGDSGFFGDLFGGINQAMQGGLGQNLLNIGQQALSGFVTQQFAPQPVSMGGGVATMASVPAIARAGGAIATVGRGFFNRFPNLATSIQALRNRGSNVSRSSLYSAMRRFGPEMLVSGGLLTAAAVSELAVAGPGRRRMNPGNVKALRRAHRRMKSFHKVCVDNDQLYKRSRKR
jgi:hypothetical protein